jgi:hypothetical protein
MERDRAAQEAGLQLANLKRLLVGKVVTVIVRGTPFKVEVGGGGTPAAWPRNSRGSRQPSEPLPEREPDRLADDRADGESFGRACPPRERHTLSRIVS